MALSEIDRVLLESCLKHEPRAWENFVDRFLGLVVHVINHSAVSRSFPLNGQDREDLCAEVFLNILLDDYGVLRRFRRQSSLATYLTVIARRIVIREMLRRPTAAQLQEESYADNAANVESRIQDRDEVERLLHGLGDREAEAVRMYHLEGRTYQEIGSRIGLSANSVGPMLSKARARMRRTGQST